MSSEWEEVTLGEVLTLQRGLDLPVQDRKHGKVPIVASNGITGYHNHAPVKAPGVVIGRSGSIGGGQYIECDYWPLNTTLWVKDFKGNDPRYCYYLLRSIDFSGLNAGSGVPTLNRNHLHPMRMKRPPVAEQKQISSMLGTIDDRIALLRETNATLEAIAQAMFKSWFVDFDPVHAKAQGIAPEGMGEATAALFPDSFEESELGLVPKGWSMTSVSQVAEVVKGKSYSSSELAAQHDTALVTLKSFARGGGFRLDGFKPYTGKYKLSQVVVSGDLIVAYTDVTQAAELIGKPAIVVGVEEYKTLVASLDVGIVRPEPSKCNRQFLYGLFRTEPFQSHTFAHTSGTTVLHLAKEGIGSFQFPCPPVELIVAYAEIAEAIVGRSQTNIDLMRTLATLRDTLLPRLISGQLRLPEAEATLEEALA